MRHRAGDGHEDDDHLSARDEVRGAVDRSVRRSRRDGGRRASRAGRATFAVLSLTHNYKVIIAREAGAMVESISINGDPLIDGNIIAATEVQFNKFAKIIRE